MIIHLNGGRCSAAFFLLSFLLSALFAVLPVLDDLAPSPPSDAGLPLYAASRLSGAQRRRAEADAEEEGGAAGARGVPPGGLLGHILWGGGDILSPAKGAAGGPGAPLSSALRRSFADLAARVRGFDDRDAGEQEALQAALEAARKEAEDKGEDGRQEQGAADKGDPLVASELWEDWTTSSALDASGDVFRLTVVVGASHGNASHALVHVLERPAAPFLTSLRSRRVEPSDDEWGEPLPPPPSERGAGVGGDWRLLYSDASVPGPADAHGRGQGGWVAVAYRELDADGVAGAARAGIRVYDPEGRHATLALDGGGSVVTAVAVLPPLREGDACALAYSRDGDGRLFRTLAVVVPAPGERPRIETPEPALHLGLPVKGPRTAPRGAVVSLSPMACGERRAPCVAVTRRVAFQARAGFTGLVAVSGGAGAAGNASSSWTTLDKGWRSKAPALQHFRFSRPATATSGDLAYLAFASSPYVASADHLRSHSPLEIVNLEPDTQFAATAVTADGRAMAIGDNHGTVIMLTSAKDVPAGSGSSMQWQVATEFRVPPPFGHLGIDSLALVREPGTPREGSGALDGAVLAVSLHGGVLVVFDVGSAPASGGEFGGLDDDDLLFGGSGLLWWDDLILLGVGLAVAGSVALQRIRARAARRNGNAAALAEGRRRLAEAEQLAREARAAAEQRLENE